MLTKRTILLWLLVAVTNTALAVNDQSVNDKLTVVGSDTLSDLMTAWAERFYGTGMGVAVEIQAVGSAAAPPALEEGTADIGTMSRRMNVDEKEGFLRRYGREPIELAVAQDAVVFIVHADNPTTSIGKDDVARVFGMPGTCGTEGRVRSWRDLDKEHEFSAKPIQVLGRTATSGTYQYFRRTGLCNGDPGIFINEVPGSAGIVNAVSRIPTALAYTAEGYVTDAVKVLGIEMDDGSVFLPGEVGYPFTRTLYMYLSGELSYVTSPNQCAFLTFMAGDLGQSTLREAGFSNPKGNGVLLLSEAANACR